MSRVRITAHADADIEQIALWIASRSDTEVALHWIADLQDALDAIADAPGMGSDQSHLRKGMRSSPFGNYLIFFRPRSRGIDVIRVVHGSRDYRRLFQFGKNA